MKANGRPGSCTGNREKPLSSLCEVESFRSRGKSRDEQVLQFLVVKHIVGADSDNVLRRKPNQRKGLGGTGVSFKIYFQGCHDTVCLLVAQFQNTAQDGDLVVL